MILLLGATGYLGQAFAMEMNQRRLPFVPLSRGAVDYTRFDTLFQYVRSTRPEFVINAAGFTGKPDLETCDVHKAETVQANTLLPQTIARVCYLTKTPWGHVSSGSIFAGAKVSQNGGFRIVRDLNLPDVRGHFESAPEHFTGFVESDEPNFSFRAPPCSFYSGTKALAEEALRWYEQCYVWRPGLVFGESDHPRNFLSHVQIASGIPDGVNSFSHQGEFVGACLDLWQKRAPFGTYHVANPGVLTGQQVAGTLQEVLKIKLPVIPESQRGASSGVETPVQPAHCFLDTQKLHLAGINLRPVREAVRDSLAKWVSPPETRTEQQRETQRPSTFNDNRR